MTPPSAFAYGRAMADRRRSWRHPWLRVSLLLRAMLNQRWDGETWEQIRREVPKAVAERALIAAAGWFN